MLFFKNNRIDELLDDDSNNFYIRIKRGRDLYIFQRGKIDINDVKAPVTKYITNVENQEIKQSKRGRKPKNED